MIIFCDIDGVLATQKSYKTGRYGLNYHCIRNLNALCKKLKADVVICSAWGNLYAEKLLKKMLKEAGLHARVRGVTPDAGSKTMCVCVWLEQNKYKGSYIILDDQPGEYPVEPSFCIPSSKIFIIKNGFLEKGLSTDHLRRILKTPLTK